MKGVEGINPDIANDNENMNDKYKISQDIEELKKIQEAKEKEEKNKNKEMEEE